MAPKAKATAKGNGKGGNDDGTTIETVTVTQHINKDLYTEEMFVAGGWSRERASNAWASLLQHQPGRFYTGEDGTVYLHVDRQQTVITFE